LKRCRIYAAEHNPPKFKGFSVQQTPFAVLFIEEASYPMFLLRVVSTRVARIRAQILCTASNKPFALPFFPDYFQFSFSVLGRKTDGFGSWFITPISNSKSSVYLYDTIQ
jgi:hypothetical protein